MAAPLWPAWEAWSTSGSTLASHSLVVDWSWGNNPAAFPSSQRVSVQRRVRRKSKELFRGSGSLSVHSWRDELKSIRGLWGPLISTFESVEYFWMFCQVHRESQGSHFEFPCGIWCIFPLSLIIPSETQYWHLWNFLYKQVIWTDV
jgi:hypothetical protein